MTVDLLEPRDKLDATMSVGAATAATGDPVVNGLSGERLDWDAVQWRRVEADVQRLRQRIFAASRAGDLKKVRNAEAAHTLPGLA